jgi:pyridoxal phosphate enzyme (YggS family)
MALDTFQSKKQQILDQISKAAEISGRSAADIALTAVSKQQPDDKTDEAILAGHRVFGENRVQEAKQRWSLRRTTVPDLHLRLIGPLQTNKAQDAVVLFDAIETLDRPSLAIALAKAIEKTGRAPSLMVQVNIGEEPQKAGVMPQEADRFIAQMRSEFGFPIAGLMCIPPIGAPPEPFFAQLAKLAERNGLPELSMGMSDDFVAAIEQGATRVRIGSALFGSR